MLEEERLNEFSFTEEERVENGETGRESLRKQKIDFRPKSELADSSSLSGDYLSWYSSHFIIDQEVWKLVYAMG